MDCRPSVSSVHGILQARILEWVAVSFSRGLLDPRIESRSPALQADSLPSEPAGKPPRLVHSKYSVQFSCSVMSDSLWPHELQQARPPCPSPTPRVHSNSLPSSLWCHLAISSSVVPFYSSPQSLPASESFPMSQLFAWGGQSIGVLALASVLPKNTQDWSPLGWTGWISLQSRELSSLLQYHSSKASILQHSAFFIVQVSHPYMTTGKTIALSRKTLLAK